MNDPCYQGGCLCGRVRFRVSGPGKNRCFCHCRSCRLASGAPFVAWATFPTDGFQLTAGELAICRSSPEVVRTFCGGCGSTIGYRHESRAADLDVAIATLDDATPLAPECHIWVSHKLPWMTLGDGLPQYAEWRD